MWALQVLGLLADKKRARDVRSAGRVYESTPWYVHVTRSWTSSVRPYTFCQVVHREFYRIAAHPPVGIALIPNRPSWTSCEVVLRYLPRKRRICNATRVQRSRGIDPTSAGKPDGSLYPSLFGVNLDILIEARPDQYDINLRDSRVPRISMRLFEKRYNFFNTRFLHFYGWICKVRVFENTGMKIRWDIDTVYRCDVERSEA